MTEKKMHLVPEQVVKATPRTDRERATITFTTREGWTTTLYITPAFAEQLYGAAAVAMTTVLPPEPRCTCGSSANCIIHGHMDLPQNVERVRRAEDYGDPYHPEHDHI
jgi:hypothetical protein